MLIIIDKTTCYS